MIIDPINQILIKGGEGKDDLFIPLKKFLPFVGLGSFVDFKSVANSNCKIEIEGSLPTSPKNNHVVFNALPLTKRSSTVELTQQQVQFNTQIQQNQQQILEIQNQIHLQLENFTIEKAQTPPKSIPHKIVIWYCKWAKPKSPFEDKIIFHVKGNANHEASLISTLKAKRNEAKANPKDYDKIVELCNSLFSSMKYIENEQSDILNDALKLLKKSVKDGCIEACSILAKLYLFGIEGAVHHTPNYEKARLLYMKVLKNTQRQGQRFKLEITYNTGLCYEQMESDEKYIQAISFFKYAAVCGHPGASFKLYKIFEPISPKESIKWLIRSKKNANKEFPDGLYEYALHCYKGYEEGGIRKNEDYTITLLKEAVEKFEHVQSALELGKYYLIKEGPSSLNAGKYLYMAACKGSKIAQYKLALWWKNQPESIVKHEIKKKAHFEWLSCSVEGEEEGEGEGKEENLPEAMYKIGWCYELGYGITKDVQMARSFYEKAASKGYSKAKEKLEKMNKIKI